MRPSQLYVAILCLPIGYAVQGQTIQQAVASGGGTSTALPGYTVDFTIGETVILTAGTDPACTQGFQQPISDTAKTDSNLTTPSWYIEIYPNPVHDQLTIHAYMDQASEIDYRLFDILGHPVLSGRLSFQQGYNDVLIDVGTISRAIYVLYMYDEVHSKYQSVKLLHD